MKYKKHFWVFYITLILSINQTNHNGKSKRIKMPAQEKGFEKLNINHNKESFYA